MRPRVIHIAIAALLLLACPARAERLMLATGEWAPYSSRNMDNLGMFPEILSLVFKEMGQDYDIRFYPWNRCYKMVRDGDIWGAFPYSLTEHRATEVLFSDVVSWSTSVFFAYGPGPDIDFQSLEDLKGVHIGGIDGYFYQEAFDRAGLDVTYVPDEQSALLMLMAGRVDLVPLNDLVGRRIIHERFPDKEDRFRTLKHPLSRNGLHLIASPEHPGSRELLERFNEALAKVLASDQAQRIMDRHGYR